jgi:hypothetical protein
MKITTRPRALLVLAALGATAATIAAVVPRAAHDAAPAALHGPGLRCAAGFVAEGVNGRCISVAGPEGNAIETQKEMLDRAARTTAPFDVVAPGAYAAGVNAVASFATTPGTWQQVGKTPLHADNPDYAGADATFGSGPSRLGWHKLSGRATAIAFDPARAGRIFASTAAGGIWESTDYGGSWRSIADSLPVQAMGGLAFSSAKGGTIIAGTGDNAFGGVLTPSGFGVYYSTNDGRSWTKSRGVPDGLTTLKVVVDPTNPNVDYVATDKGLYRSADDGASYANVVLPTTCTDTTRVECSFANVVTDVAVRPADANGQHGGAVIAAVGWEYGQKTAKGGFEMAPQNGIYTSPTGQKGTFTFQQPSGFAPTPNVGRTTLAIASGPGQNHNVVYALVQDATKLQNCIDEANLPPACTGTGDEVLATATYLNGGYVSTDFGKTWTQILQPDQLRAPGTGSALEIGILGYGPGIQSWYNNWVAVDPTVKDASGNPTRVLFGLEEIWENDQNGSGVTGQTSWHTIGRYWNACLQEVAGVNCADTTSPLPGSTTHPDQHAAALAPDGQGGVTLYAGNDGGVFKQHIDAGQDFSNDNWGEGINSGLASLQPYDAEIAKDGTIVAGLQDNGEMMIHPDGTEDMIFGGDGFFTGIDPNNSKRIVEEYANGNVSGTVDGGRTWQNLNPGVSSPRFSAPLQLDPGNANHAQIVGRQVMQIVPGDTPYRVDCSDPVLTEAGCQSFINNWTTVFDLGTTAHPGVAPSTTETSFVANSGTAEDFRGDKAYVGYCGPCSVVTNGAFASGIATNVAGPASPKYGQTSGWHIAKAQGLPERYVTSITIDPSDSTGKTVYVTLGGYTSHWIPPGWLGEDTSKVGTGHVYVSHDAGTTFTDASGNLPDVPADWLIVRQGRLVVGNDLGVFMSSGSAGGTYTRLGTGLPAVPISHIAVDPAHANRIVVATFGRGVWSYTFTN